MFIEIPATKRSMSGRKPKFGVGTNDADYTTESTVNNKRYVCPFYRKWCDMIRRCYDIKHHDRFPTYKECSVCEEWLTFSNFKSWMIKQNWEDMTLDKDIIKPGNKVYSPEGCAFIPRELNLLLVDRAALRGSCPQGVHWDKARGKYQAKVSDSGKVKPLGRFATSEQASAVYIKAKVKIILEAANQQSDERIANGLRLHAQLLQG
jgi:hypothetical protein